MKFTKHYVDPSRAVAREEGKDDAASKRACFNELAPYMQFRETVLPFLLIPLARRYGLFQNETINAALRRD